MSSESDLRYLQIIMDDLLQMQNAPHYNTWLHELVKPCIGKRVLDIGPGIGDMSRKIIDLVIIGEGIDDLRRFNSEEFVAALFDA